MEKTVSKVLVAIALTAAMRLAAKVKEERTSIRMNRMRQAWPQWQNLL